MRGTLFVVATPIGNLEDITARALRVLGHVSIIAAEDTRRTAHLLARYAITTPTTSLHEHNENSKTPALIARLDRGESVAVVSDAGTPTLSDPGQRLIAAAIAASIKIEAIPGPSAVLAALAGSGFRADSFTFLGFPPTRSKDRNIWFERLAALDGTVVFFEAPHRIQATLQRIQTAIGDCTVVLGRELTKIHEELVRGPISAVLEGLAAPRGEFTVVVDIPSVESRAPRATVSDHDLLIELGLMTDNMGLARRQAITALSRKHGRASSDIYAAIERAKKLVR